MHQEGETRVLVGSVPLLANGDRIGIPVAFGIGRKDRAVRLWGLHAEIQSIAVNPIGVTAWAIALSVNPEHEGLNNPPTLVFAHDDEALYAFAETRHTALTVDPNPAAVERAIAIPLHTQTGLSLDLYGLLRPFRQILCFWNESDTDTKLRCDIYYSPVEEGRVDLDSLNRQKGAYRRT